ncbi:hypothetical protein UPYG_G00145190 [Umbra pygmaea]|uniref:Uncharacterized protein n=1 Tax=Umbra pygmaea TaxID=75934 RepID=A0ABD0XEG0_UMBPY
MLTGCGGEISCPVQVRPSSGIGREARSQAANLSRKSPGMRADVYDVIKNMTGAPISYLVNQTAVRVTVQGKELPIGCGLSYQHPSGPA